MTNSGVFVAEPIVRLNDFEQLWAEVGSNVLDTVRIVGESGWYVLGKEVEAFELELAAYWKQGFAVGVATGLDAIEIGLRCCGCGRATRCCCLPYPPSQRLWR